MFRAISFFPRQSYWKADRIANFFMLKWVKSTRKKPLDWVAITRLQNTFMHYFNDASSGSSAWTLENERFMYLLEHRHHEYFQFLSIYIKKIQHLKEKRCLALLEFSLNSINYPAKRKQNIWADSFQWTGLNGICWVLCLRKTNLLKYNWILIMLTLPYCVLI